MKKLKERLKRGLAMMMAAASIVSVFPSMNVSAASETAKITFAYCHDGAGNTIKYQQTVTHDGRVCGEAGDARTRIYADGEPAFCMPRTRRSGEQTEPSMKLHIRRGNRAAGLWTRQRKSTEPLKKLKQRKQPTRETVAGAVPPTGSHQTLPHLPPRQAGESLTSRKSR